MIELNCSRCKKQPARQNMKTCQACSDSMYAQEKARKALAEALRLSTCALCGADDRPLHLWDQPGRICYLVPDSCYETWLGQQYRAAMAEVQAEKASYQLKYPDLRDDS